MTSDELKQVNEEFKKANFGYLNQLIQLEEKIIGDTQGIIMGLKVPRLGLTITDKINELFSNFEVSNEPLRSQVIVVLTLKYLMIAYQNYVFKVDSYMRSFISAKEANDKDRGFDILRKRADFELLWDRFDSDLRNLDFRKDLELMVSSVKPLPCNAPKETILKLCTEELNNINYSHKNVMENNTQRFM